MVAAALLLLAVQQAAPPELVVSLDRDQVAVGEELLLTVRARSNSTLPMDVRIGPTDGFLVVSRTEGTSVSTDATVSRTKTIELRLRAIRAGDWRLGPFRARQGDAIAEVAVLTVKVTDAGSAALAAQVNPRIRALLERARPPSTPGAVGLSLIVSSAEATVGEQVDIVTAAWFPRDLRLQLRRAPTLVPPAVEGMWSYPQPAPVGIAASRKVGGQWYDLFVAHQIAFPVRSGELAIAPAQMQYSVPLALQFFSQEERFSVTSDSGRLLVRPIPAAGQPPGFAGAVGTDLVLERVVNPPTARAREPVHVSLVVRGAGNVTLWPEPAVTWPAGVRAYPDVVEERPETRNGTVVGSKSFGFSLVADSVGTVMLPAVEYPYYDLGVRAFRVARLPATALAVAAPTGAAEAALPPGLLTARTPLIPPDLPRSPGTLGWLVLLVAPPALWAMAILTRRARPSRAPVPAARRRSIRHVEIELDGLVTGLAPSVVASGDRSDLSAALRAAGLEPATVTELLSLREVLRQRRYAPSQEGEDEAIVARWEQLRAGLAGGGRRRRVPHGLLAGVLLAVVTLPAALRAQSAEADYEAGALDAARAAFATRAAAQPDIAAHWYNLGATDFRLGDPALATAEWTRALRLAPRSATIRTALHLTPPTDPITARRLWTAPVAPSELVALGGLLWLLGWAGFLLRPARRARWAWLGAAGLLLLASGWGLAAWYARPVAVVRGSVPLRVSPHGRGSALANLDEGQAVLREGVRHEWWLVRDPSGRLGWLPAAAVVPVNPE